MRQHKSYKHIARPAGDTSYRTVLNRLRDIAYRRALTRKRRRRQFGLKTLIFVVAFFAALFAASPFVFQTVYVKYRVITDAEFKEKTMADLLTRRPGATKYRHEHLASSDWYGYVLYGEYFVNGKWKEYSVRGDPATWPRTLVGDN